MRYIKFLNDGSSNGEEDKSILNVTPNEVVLNHTPNYFFPQNSEFQRREPSICLIQIEN